MEDWLKKNGFTVFKWWVVTGVLFSVIGLICACPVLLYALALVIAPNAIPFFPSPTL